MEKLVDVLVWENKENEGRYLAASMEYGDESDPNLDNGIDRIGYCMIATSKNPQSNNLESLVASVKNNLETHEKMITDNFGSDAFVSFRYSELVKHYTPKMISIPYSKFVTAMCLD